MKRLTLNEFIEKARNVHNDNYDYSKVAYVNCTTKVCIICPNHGEFWQRPSDHLRGHGCPKCKGVCKNTNEMFIEKARKVHNDKYDYSKVEYVNNKTKVCIVCPKHGEFWQKPNCHLSGDRCPKCSKYKNIYTTETWVEKARKVHNDKYDYSKVEYKNSHTKVCIICPNHGEFWQTPLNHICGKTMCPKCSKIYPHSKLENSIGDFLLKTYPNFTITREKKFEWLKNKTYLPIDFFIEELNIGIEVQGGQHYYPIPRFGGKSGFEERQFLDKLKKKLCNDNGVTILYVSSKTNSIINFKKKIQDIINEAANT